MPATEPLKLTPALRSMLERINKQSGDLLMLQVTASGGREYSKLNKLRNAGYVVKCDHPSVKDRRSDWPADALAITEAGRAALLEKAEMTTTKFYRGGIEISIADLTAEMEASAEDAGVPIEVARSIVAGCIAGDACGREAIKDFTGCVAVDEVELLLTVPPGHP